MTILDYLTSDNIDNQCLGLRLLGVKPKLIKKFKKKPFVHYLFLHSFFLKVDDFTIYFYQDYDKNLLEIINQIAEYKTISKKNYTIEIKFIKLKEINYDNN